MSRFLRLKPPGPIRRAWRSVGNALRTSALDLSLIGARPVVASVGSSSWKEFDDLIGRKS